MNKILFTLLALCVSMAQAYTDKEMESAIMAAFEENLLPNRTPSSDLKTKNTDSFGSKKGFPWDVYECRPNIYNIKLIEVDLEKKWMGIFPVKPMSSMGGGYRLYTEMQEKSGDGYWIDTTLGYGKVAITTPATFGQIPDFHYFQMDTGIFYINGNHVYCNQILKSGSGEKIIERRWQ